MYLLQQRSSPQLSKDLNHSNLYHQLIPDLNNRPKIGNIMKAENIQPPNMIGRETFIISNPENNQENKTANPG